MDPSLFPPWMAHNILFLILSAFVISEPQTLLELFGIYRATQWNLSCNPGKTFWRNSLELLLCPMFWITSFLWPNIWRMLFTKLYFLLLVMTGWYWMTNSFVCVNFSIQLCDKCCSTETILICYNVFVQKVNPGLQLRFDWVAW